MSHTSGLSSNFTSPNDGEPTLTDGRVRNGEQNIKAVLTSEQVAEIYLSSAPSKDLAERFNINPRTVRAIRQGTRWTWLTSTLRKDGAA